MTRTPFLVDVPVRVNIWIRPELQRKQFDVIRKAKPSIIFLQSDGGRNSDEWEAIHENRKIYEEEVDWECTIHKIFEEKNLGLYEMSIKSTSYIWKHVDRCIFLEDDQIPSISYFNFCAELLEKYKDDLRVDCICGVNILGEYENCSSDYFFSRQGSIWGIATWKRFYDMRDTSFDYAKDPYTYKLLKHNTKYNKTFLNRLTAYPIRKYYEGHIAGAEFFHEFAMYGYNQLQIVPKVNLVSNIGTTENSENADNIEHLPRGIRRVFGMKTYEIEKNLIHPKYVIPDLFYEKIRNKIMGYNKPLIKFYRTLERIIIKIKKGDFKYIMKKFKKKINDKRLKK